MIFNSNNFVENIYHLLWQKDTNVQKQYQIRIPDTIVFRYDTVQNWYFTTENCEILVKKNRNLEKDIIYDYFTNQIQNRSEILATLISQQNLDHTKRSVQEMTSPNDNEKIIIRYLDQNSLHQFLFDKGYQHSESSVLQRFVQPYGEYNQEIQAVWSKSVCVFTQRSNIQKLYHFQYDTYEKAVTFDGGEAYSRTVPLNGQKYSIEMRRQVENIAQHIALVTNFKTIISRMVLYFKTDKHDKTYFLYCSSIRIRDEKEKNKSQVYSPNPTSENIRYPISIDTNYEKPPEIKRVITVNTMRPQKMINDCICIDCSKYVQQEDLFPIKYKMLVEHFEKQKDMNDDIQLNSVPISAKSKKHALLIEFEQDYRVPLIFQQIYPELNYQSYNQIKRNHQFQNLSIILCQQCYLQYTETQREAGSKPQIQSFFQFKPTTKIEKNPFDLQLKIQFQKEHLSNLDKFNQKRLQTSHTQRDLSEYSKAERNLQTQTDMIDQKEPQLKKTFSYTILNNNQKIQQKNISYVQTEIANSESRTFQTQRMGSYSPRSPHDHQTETRLLTSYQTSRPKLNSPSSQSNRPVSTRIGTRDSIFNILFSQSNQSPTIYSPQSRMGTKFNEDKITELKTIYNNFKFPLTARQTRQNNFPIDHLLNSQQKSNNKQAFEKQNKSAACLDLYQKFHSKTLSTLNNITHNSPLSSPKTSPKASANSLYSSQTNNFSINQVNKN